MLAQHCYSQRPSASLAILCDGPPAAGGEDLALSRPLGDESLLERALRQWSPDFAEVLIVASARKQAADYRSALATTLAQTPRPVRIVCLARSDDDGGSSSDWAAKADALVELAAHRRVVFAPIAQLGVRRRHLRLLIDALEHGPRADFVTDEGQTLAFPHARCKVDAAGPAAPGRQLVGESAPPGASQESGARQRVAAGDQADELAAQAQRFDALRAYFGTPLFDGRGRRLHYLRFSLTEACNMACTYCLPKGFPEWSRHRARLDMASIETLLGGFRQLGFRKVRFTGGEPTLHPDCKRAIAFARRLGFEQIALTTNGLRLGEITPWIEAGLTALNVSLDSLDEALFSTMTQSRGLARVRRLIEAAAQSDELTVKVNTVLMRSANGAGAHIERMIDWALAQPVTLRFIELMETKLNGSFAAHERVLGHEIIPLLAARGLAPSAAASAGEPTLQGPESTWQHRDWPGRIGLINPMSCNFCHNCNRLRLTARGALKLCLFGNDDLPLDRASPAAVALNVRQFIDRKPERHSLDEGNVGNVATFRTIGG